MKIIHQAIFILPQRHLNLLAQRDGQRVQVLDLRHPYHLLDRSAQLWRELRFHLAANHTPAREYPGYSSRCCHVDNEH
jgi:hypothetical protein